MILEWSSSYTIIISHHHMTSYDDIIVWRHMTSSYDIILWRCHMASSYDVTIWHHHMSSYDIIMCYPRQHSTLFFHDLVLVFKHFQCNTGTAENIIIDLDGRSGAMGTFAIASWVEVDVIQFLDMLSTTTIWKCVWRAWHKVGSEESAGGNLKRWRSREGGHGEKGTRHMTHGVSCKEWSPWPWNRKLGFLLLWIRGVEN